jgi:hypothetical protein
VVLEKDGEDQLDRSCEKLRSIATHVIEGKLERRLELRGKQAGRRKQLLDELMEKRGYRKLK